MDSINKSINAIDSLSQRGQELANNPARIDMSLFAEAFANLYHSTDNPEGAFPLNIAENSLVSSEVKGRFEQIMQTQPMPGWVLKYTSSLGNPEVREVIASFMRRYFGSQAIVAANIAFSAGAGASLEVASFVLSDAQDVVVIPAPSYPMYTKDLGIKSQMQRYDLQTHEEIEGHDSLALVTIPVLEKALVDIENQGKIFKMLLITSPDNPTGTVYTGAQLEEIAQWCIAQKIHLVVNEIYAFSQIITTHPSVSSDFKKEIPFSSFTKIMEAHQSDYLHLIYALSKDFGISGFRFGIIHSLNEAFIRGLENVNIPHMVSNVAQWLVGEFFKDEAWIKNYITENQRKITESYAIATATLKQMNVPYVPSRGSLFIWADFSQFLQEDSAQGQEDLWVDIFKKTGILLTPGQGFQHKKRGLFRLVYTAVPATWLQVAMERLSAYRP